MCIRDRYEGRHQLVVVFVAATKSRGTARIQAIAAASARKAAAIAAIQGVASWQAKRRGGGLVPQLPDHAGLRQSQRRRTTEPLARPAVLAGSLPRWDRTRHRPRIARLAAVSYTHLRAH